MTQVRGVVGLVVIVCRRCRRLRRSGCRVLERLELGLKIENVLTNDAAKFVGASQQKSENRLTSVVRSV